MQNELTVLFRKGQKHLEMCQKEIVCNVKQPLFPYCCHGVKRGVWDPCVVQRACGEAIQWRHCDSIANLLGCHRASIAIPLSIYCDSHASPKWFRLQGSVGVSNCARSHGASIAPPLRFLRDSYNSNII